MAFLEITDPFDDDQPPARPVPDGPPPPRPDWLVGADEGAASEINRVGPQIVHRPAPPQPTPPQPPTSAVTAPAPPPAPAFPGMRGAAEPRGGIVSEVAGGWLDQNSMSWSADAQRPVGLDADTETAAARSTSIAAPAEALTQEGALAARAKVIEANAAARAAAMVSVTALPASARSKPKLPPWWVGVIERVRTDRVAQIAAGVVVLAAIVVFAFASRKAEGISISSIRRDAKALDGQTVVVSGRVGEVFPIGGSFAFNLHQGRDTIVVFTRLRKPQTDQKIKVTGSISTGFLDGVPRAALFEDRVP